MTTSVFEQVTSSLTVMAICGALGPDIRAGTPLFELESLLDPGEDPNLDPWNDPSRVIDSGGNIVGILWYENWDQIDGLVPETEEESDMYDVNDVMERPEPWQFLSSATTILEAVELFAIRSTSLFYVLHGNQVVGHLRYSHLFHPVGRLAFLALALEVEEQALRLCQHPPFREDAWQAISDNRRRKAIELYRQRYGCEPEPPKHIDRLIDCTQLEDKATMIWKTKLISSISSRSELLGFFRRLEEIRNYCAHPQRSHSVDDPIPKQKLSNFINDAKFMRETLNEALSNHGVTRQHRPTLLPL
jgi:hypothetical protein